MEKQNNKRRFFRRRKKQQASKPKGNYAFIDSQNLNLGVQRVGWKMDWKKFRKFLTDKYSVEKAYMFIGYVPDNIDLYRQMKEAGYIVVLKPTVDMLMSKEELESDDHVTKGNADAELVLYAMKELAFYDKAIVVSGDGDFYCIVEYLKQQNKFAKLLTPNNHYSSLYKLFEQDIDVLDVNRKELAYGFIKPKKQNRSTQKTKKSTQSNKPKAKKSAGSRRKRK